MRIIIVTADGRNFRNLNFLISALEPGTEGPGEGKGLVVTMLGGEPVTLHGAQADAFRAHLLAVATPPPGGLPTAETFAQAQTPPGNRLVIGHDVPIPRQTAETSASSTEREP